MKKQRILLMVHKALIPPEDVSGMSDGEIDRFRTEYNVLAALQNLGHQVEVIGLGDRLTDLRLSIRDFRPHIVFNLLDEFSGIESYDYYVVAYLELKRQRYTGCNPRGMMISRDKVLTKQVLASHRIATPRFALFPFGRRFREPKRLQFPLFVKSATEDASLGISQASVVDDMVSLRDRIGFIHEHVQTDALVEEYIDGRELYVGVLGNQRLTTFPIWEIDFGHLSREQARIATRAVKWNSSYQKRHGISTRAARDLSEEQRASIEHLAKRIFRALHMSGYARMDLRLREDGKVFLLEANANPDLTYGEDFAESAAATGLAYEPLIRRIVSIGLAYRPEWRMFEA
jgi:D-alanine-D-alanine ligase